MKFNKSILIIALCFVILECNGKAETLTQGETVLIPAEIDEVKLIPKINTRLLEISM